MHESFETFLKNHFSEKRFIHSLNVAKMASELAVIHKINPKKAYLAGLLHDVTKEYTLPQHLEIMGKYNVSPHDVRVFDVNVFHGFTGSIFAKEVLGVEGRDILNAIKHHITGHVGMTTLEKIIFIADGISAERNYPGVEDIRELAKKDLNRAVLKKFINNINKFSFEKEKVINPNAFEAYNDIVTQL